MYSYMFVEITLGVAPKVSVQRSHLVTSQTTKDRIFISHLRTARSHRGQRLG